MMPHLAIFAALLVSASALAVPSPAIEFDEDITITLDSLPDFEYAGVTVSTDGGVTIVIKDPGFKYGKFNGTTPSVTFDTKAISIHINHYNMSGEILIFDFAGEGTMDISMTDIQQTFSYQTLDDQNSFCALNNTMEFEMNTGDDQFKITGVKDKWVENKMITELNGRNKIGAAVTEVLGNLGYYAMLNKYGFPMINSICHML